MKSNEKSFYARILIVIGIGVALSVALDSNAIGIGVASVFLAGLIVGKNKITGEMKKKNDE